MFLLIVTVVTVSRGVFGIPLEQPNDALDSRIHGGVDAPKSYAPHMAALLTGDRLIFIVCGGSIVTKKHILTAAHCITPFVENDGRLSPTFHGRVGSKIWHSGGLKIHFEGHHVHPKWDEDNIKNDIGVLSLTKCLELNDKVAVIGLEFGWVGGGEKIFVTGWGRTGPRIEEDAVNLAPTPDDLQLLYAKTLTNKLCAKIMTSSQHWASIAPHVDPILEICTLHSFGHGMCHGDSGSPVVSEASGLQVGAVSWGMPCAVGAPDVHTRVSGMGTFLQPIMNTCSCS